MCIAYDNRYFALKKVVIGLYDASTFANPTFAQNHRPGRCRPKTSCRRLKKKIPCPPPWHAARATSTGAIYPAFAGTRGEVRGTFPQNG